MKLHFDIGNKVRDKANLGGVVLETWGAYVKVRWNNEATNWIDARFLRLDHTARAEQGRE